MASCMCHVTQTQTGSTEGPHLLAALAGGLLGLGSAGGLPAQQGRPGSAAPAVPHLPRVQPVALAWPLLPASREGSAACITCCLLHTRRPCWAKNNAPLPSCPVSRVLTLCHSMRQSLMAVHALFVSLPGVGALGADPVLVPQRLSLVLRDAGALAVEPPVALAAADPEQLLFSVGLPRCSM